MSVSTELLCSFELLKPLDSNALKNHIKKGRNKRIQMLNSPVRLDPLTHVYTFFSNM
jgi:serine/threonine-protein phosphatase PP1 catalytic subunit